MGEGVEAVTLFLKNAQRGEEYPLEIVFGSFSYIVPKCLLVFKLLLIFPIIDFGDRQDLQY